MSLPEMLGRQHLLRPPEWRTRSWILGHTGRRQRKQIFVLHLFLLRCCSQHQDIVDFAAHQAAVSREERRTSSTLSKGLQDVVVQGTVTGVTSLSLIWIVCTLRVFQPSDLVQQVHRGLWEESKTAGKRFLASRSVLNVVTLLTRCKLPCRCSVPVLEMSKDAGHHAALGGHGNPTLIRNAKLQKVPDGFHAQTGHGGGGVRIFWFNAKLVIDAAVFIRHAQGHHFRLLKCGR